MPELFEGAKPVVMIATADRPRAVPFYRDLLGLRLVAEDDYATVFLVGGVMLRLSTVPGWAPPAHTVFGFEVPDAAAAARALTARGVAMIRYPYFEQDGDGLWSPPGGGAKVGWFLDPDGNNLSIAQFGG
jgi:catechol 2,3-dioxygenase-like lactoylglutathione lyase family enzyme